jgi:hypothetical protein
MGGGSACARVCERAGGGGKNYIHISGFHSLYLLQNIKMIKSRSIGSAGPVMCGKDEKCIQNFRQKT